MRPLSPDRFNAVLNAEQGAGQHMLWRRAAVCPCRDPISGAAVQACVTCAGKGVTWAAAVRAWAGAASMKVMREWAQFGLWESGDVVVSIPSDSPLYAAGEQDRVTMTDSSEPFSVVLSAPSVGPLPFIAFQVDRAFWLDTGLNIVNAPALPSIAADGSLAWPTGAAPAAGAQFSLSGRKRPEYYLFRDLPQDRAHFGGTPLPRRVALRKFDLFGR